MFKRRRRRARVAWLPIIGESHNDTAAVQGDPSRLFGINRNTIIQAPQLAPAASGRAVQVSEFVTFDDTHSVLNLEYDENYSGSSLKDLTAGNEYKLRRIIGKVHATWYQASGEYQFGGIEFAAGLMVRRLSDNVAVNELDSEIHPLQGTTAEDPWIWRRKWILGEESSVNFPYSYYPRTTAGYGSVQDGPHLDQKTSRVIKREERLVMHFAARAINHPAGALTFIGTNGFNVHINWEVRLLGSLRASTYGNRGRASR